MKKMHDFLLDLLVANNHEWLTRIIGFGQLDIEPSGYIGTKRNADLLVTILNTPYCGRQKLAIEVESAPDFDVDKILQKIKKDQPCPTVAIIPKACQEDAWRFQKNLIKVWLWDVKFRWKCNLCKNTFTTISSIQPRKCEKCKKRGDIEFEEFEQGDKPFVERNNNPVMNWGDIQAKLKPKHLNAWRFG